VVAASERAAEEKKTVAPHLARALLPKLDTRLANTLADGDERLGRHPRAHGAHVGRRDLRG
jgi:hypothetical protein